MTRSLRSRMLVAAASSSNGLILNIVPDLARGMGAKPLRHIGIRMPGERYFMSAGAGSR